MSRELKPPRAELLRYTPDDAAAARRCTNMNGERLVLPLRAIGADNLDAAARWRCCWRCACRLDSGRAGKGKCRSMAA